MSTELEKYLKTRRKDLDVENPDEALIWKGIRNRMQEKVPAKSPGLIWPRIRNIAAAGIIILALGYMIGDLSEERKDGQIYTLSSFDPELGRQEMEYRKLVAYKMEEASGSGEIDNMIIAELFQEIRVLDTIYEKCLRDLEELGYNELVINTIFDTYEKKIYLLELIILENNKPQDHEKETNLYL